MAACYYNVICMLPTMSDNHHGHTCWRDSTLIVINVFYLLIYRKTIVWLICDQSADSSTLIALGEPTQVRTYVCNWHVSNQQVVVIM